MKMALSILVATLLSVFLQAQNSDILAIKRLINNQVEAWNNGNIDEFMLGYAETDSLLFIGKRGRNYGWKTTLNNYKIGYPDKASMGNLSFEELRFEKLAPKIYFVTGKWKIIRISGNLEGWFSLIVQKIKGQWKITHDHSI